MLDNPFDTVMLTMVAVAAIICVRVLRDVTSSSRKRRYARAAKCVLLLSLVIGVALSFYESTALLVAEATGIVILASALYYSVIGSRLISHLNLRGLWLPSDVVKEWFLYISIFAAVIGIASGVLSVVLPYFSSALSVPVTVSTIYASISILSALFAFTVLTPEKTTIIGLVYAFAFVTRRFSEDKEFYIEDIDFEKIVTNTTNTEFDVREALESLVKQGFAVKQSPTPMGRVRFKINIYGAKYLEVCWTETLIRISRQKDRLEKTLAYVEHRLKSLDASGSRIISKAFEEIEMQEKALKRLREDYGMAIGDAWYQKTILRIDWLEAGFREAEAHYQKKEAQSKPASKPSPSSGYKQQ